MKKNHFVHSLWTKPMQLDEKKIEVTVLNYALSVAYLKRLGCTVNLHTDSLGAKLLGNAGYDNIYLTGDEIPETINPIVFAYIKSVALENEPVGTVHIDGDVFIKKPECIDRIFNHNCDCVAQSCETELPWINESLSFMIPFLGENLLSDGNRLEIRKWDYNTGVIGFFNEELKNLYISNYQRLAEKFSKYEYLSIWMNSYGKFYCPDFVLEQQLMAHLTNSSKVRFVLPVDSAPYIDERNNFAKHIGYTHLLGPTKYEENVIEKVRNRLKEFGILEDICGNLKVQMSNLKF